MNRTRFVILTLAICLILGSTFPLNRTAGSPLSTNIVSTSSDAFPPGELIVKFRENSHLRKVDESPSQVVRALISTELPELEIRSIEPLASLTTNSRLNDLIAGRGLDRTMVLKFDPSVDVQGMISLLSSRPDIEYAEPNYRIQLGSLPNDPLAGQQWALRNLGIGVDGEPSTLAADIEALAAWEITTGSPEVIVAVTDTGIDIQHPDLAANIYRNPDEIAANGVDDDRNGYIDDINGFDVADNDNSVNDIVGHGTQMAGIIAAVMNNGVGMSGACQSKLLPVKFFRKTGAEPELFDASVGDAAKSLLYSIAAGASIINASWLTTLPNNTSGQSNALRDAVSATNDAGVLLVCIAGNTADNNDHTKIYPGAYQLPNQIVTAASDYNDELWHVVNSPNALLSGFGKRTVHLAAPGVSVLTTQARGDCFTCSKSSNADDWYSRIDGTSAAAAFVSAVAALVRTRYPDDYVTLTKRRLLEGVKRVEKLEPFVITSGRLSAAGALTVEPVLIPAVLTRFKYKTSSGKLLIYGERMQEGAVVLIGNRTFTTKPKKEDLSILVSKIPSGVLTPGSSVAVRLRNPDGSVSAARTLVVE